MLSFAKVQQIFGFVNPFRLILFYLPDLSKQF